MHCRVNKLAQGFNTAVLDSNPGPLSRASECSTPELYNQLNEYYYVEFLRNQPVLVKTAIDSITRCTTDVKSWMASHNLLINESNN